MVEVQMALWVHEFQDMMVQGKKKRGNVNVGGAFAHPH